MAVGDRDASIHLYKANQASNKNKANAKLGSRDKLSFSEQNIKNNYIVTSLLGLLAKIKV